MDGYDFRRAVISATEYLAFFDKDTCTFNEPIEVENLKGEKKRVIPTISLKEVFDKQN